MLYNDKWLKFNAGLIDTQNDKGMKLSPYEQYVIYGDKKVLYDNIDAKKSWVSYCLENSSNFSCDCYNYGDLFDIKDKTEKDLVSTAFFANDALITARMCEWLEDNEAETYYQLYENIKTAFRATFMLPASEGYKLKTDSQTAYLVAYMFGLVSGTDVLYNIKMSVLRNNCHLTSGLIGQKFMFPALCELGFVAMAYKLIADEKYPSYNYFMVDGGISDAKFCSENCANFGDSMAWIYKYVLGINPSQKADGVGFKKLKIKPYIDICDNVTKASGSYSTIKGQIVIAWKKIDKNIFTFSATTPKSIDCVFDFCDYIVKQHTIINNENIFILKTL